MDFNHQNIKTLWQLYVENKATPEQVQQLYDFIKEPYYDSENQALYETFLAQLPLSSSVNSTSKAFVINNIVQAHPELEGFFSSSTAVSKQLPVTRRVRFMRKWGWAAAIILLLSSAALWYTQFYKTGQPSETKIAVQSVDITPGTNRALLTIGSATPINLSNHKSGIVAANNAITYEDGERIADAGQMLTLATPRGGQYQAVLPDGSKVWLNAASSIRFPSKFSGNKREVEVSGEVYMEVAQNAAAAFYVKAGKATIQVLGTSFNVNAYLDEAIQKTTLVSGAVKVLAFDRSGQYEQARVLQPGQQAEIVEGSKMINVQRADIAKTLAWKNGIFDFNGLDLSAVMRQLARWYDLEIKYEGVPPVKEFRGEMPRNLQLSSVLNAFKGLNLQFSLEGKTLIIKEK